MPPDDHRVARTDARRAPRARSVLMSDDQLARLLGLHAIFRLIPEIGPLLDAARDMGGARAWRLDGR